MPGYPTRSRVGASTPIATEGEAESSPVRTLFSICAETAQIELFLRFLERAFSKWGVRTDSWTAGDSGTRRVCTCTATSNERKQ